MKLLTFRSGSTAGDRLGALLPDGDVLDLTAAAQQPEFASLLSLIEAGETAWARARELVARPAAQCRVSSSQCVMRAPIARPPQFRDSMSFHKHIIQASITLTKLNAKASGDPEKIAAAEALRPETFPLADIYKQQPTYYKGNRFNVADPGEDIPWPSYSKVMDFELELACIIGKQGKDIPKSRAHEYIFGYTIFNDFSARDAQAKEMDGRLGPAKGKDFDKANVFGPCVVTADEIGDPYQLRMMARVNNTVWCDGNSNEMYWKFDDLLAHISAGETLYPGEIIASGTVGDGCGLEHNRFLNAGDVVELEIEKIGVLRNRVTRP